MRLSTFPLLLLLTAGMAASAVAAEAGSIEPTADQYVTYVGGGAEVIPAGQLTISGRRMSCGRRPTVIDPNLDDFGAAYPGFLILNPVRLSTVPPPVAMWIYSHECGHQFRGPDEETADCFAVQRGRRQGWLTPQGVEQICNFISPAEGDSMHFAGPQRCASIRQCYGDSKTW
ncbi:MAG: hypothetical protein R3D33_12225 [Hyphomicrobiaceae bacterium]